MLSTADITSHLGHGLGRGGGRGAEEGRNTMLQRGKRNDL